MGVVNVKGLAITNRDASPPLLSEPQYAKGALINAYDLAIATNGDSIASKYRLCQVPSNARVKSVVLQCAAIGAGALTDIGVYYPTLVPHDFTKNAAVIDADYFATAVDISAALAPVNVTNESGTNTLAKQQLPLWSALGLSEDPNCMLDIVCTLTAAAAATGAIALNVDYSL